MKMSKINNEKGVSLVFVIIVLLVMSLLSTAVFTLFVSNMRTAQLQENTTRAHYIAISGVELTFASLTMGTSSTRLLRTYFDKPISETVAPLTQTISLDGGSAAVTASSYIESGNRWVKITSIGTLNDGTNVSRTIEMKFRVEYPEIQMWD